MVRRRSDLNPHLEPHRLTHFLAVLEQGGFNRAARACGVTQQALSKSIAKLESALEIKLFDRTAQGVRPTAFAERLAIRARLIIAEARIAAAEIEALRGFRSGLVRIGAGPSLAVRLAPQAVAELRRRLPDVGVSITVGNTQTLTPLLIEGQLDLVISAPLASVEVDGDLEVVTLGHEVDHVVARVDHPLRALETPKIADFAAYPWIGEAHIAGVLGRVSDICIQNGVEPPIDVITTDSVATVKGLLLETDALCLLSSEFYAVERAAGLLAPIAAPAFDERRDVRLHQRRRGRLTSAARLMHEILHRRFSERQPEE